MTQVGIEPATPALQPGALVDSANTNICLNDLVF